MSATWWLLLFVRAGTSTATAATSAGTGSSAVATSTLGLTAEDLALARYLDVLESDWALLESLATVEDLIILESAEAEP